MAFPFLTAQWTNLFLVTYSVAPNLLTPRLPTGLELEMIDGSAFVSLVAFDFVDTRVLGIPWPGYRNFPEVNLRCYVRHGSERGVLFLRELVPLRLVAWLARWLYNEPYVVTPMTSQVREGPEQLTVEHRVQFAGRTNHIWAIGKKPAFQPALNTTEDFFKEHRWGYGISRDGSLTRFEVIHPVWKVYPVLDYQVDLDWGMVYGPEWEFLGRTKPVSTILAVGSPIQVYPYSKMSC